MEIEYNEKDKLLTFFIFEEIDENCTSKIKNKMDHEIEYYMPKNVIIDLKNVNFMDSAGIGLIIGRYKMTNMIGGEFKIANVNEQVKKIFNMSGISRLIPIIDTLEIIEG